MVSSHLRQCPPNKMLSWGFKLIFIGIYSIYKLNLIFCNNFHIHTVHLNTIKVFLYSPTDAQVNYLKNSFKIYIKIDIITAPTCFGAVTPSSRSVLFELAKVTVVKIVN
jgi:hypothetical protein